MASAWGDSWGSAWGDSWGITTPTPTPTPASAGSSGSGAGGPTKQHPKLIPWETTRSRFDRERLKDYPAPKKPLETQYKMRILKPAKMERIRHPELWLIDDDLALIDAIRLD